MSGGLDDRDLAALPDRTRRRLDRFAAEFERLGAGEYALFATSAVDDPEPGAAGETALEALGSDSRRRAARAAADTFVDWAAQGYSRRLALPDTILLYQALPDRPEDRLRFAAALRAAIIGLVAWDELSDDELGPLLGGFAEMAARAAATPSERHPDHRQAGAGPDCRAAASPPQPLVCVLASHS